MLQKRGSDNSETFNVLLVNDCQSWEMVINSKGLRAGSIQDSLRTWSVWNWILTKSTWWSIVFNGQCQYGKWPFQTMNSNTSLVDVGSLRHVDTCWCLLCAKQASPRCSRLVVGNAYLCHRLSNRWWWVTYQACEHRQWRDINVWQWSIPGGQSTERCSMYGRE